MNITELQALGPITEGNEHFDPAAYDTEVLGFFEEYIAEDSSSGYGYTLLGNRTFRELPTRPLGSTGRIVIELDKTIVLQRGHKTVTVKIKPGQKIKCFAMIQPLCGKSK